MLMLMFVLGCQSGPNGNCTVNADCQTGLHCMDQAYKLGESYQTLRCVSQEDADETCRARPGSTCGTQGNCTAVAEIPLSQCGVVSDADCASAAACGTLGHCSFLDGKCVVGKDADCAQHKYCPLVGYCSAANGECVAGKDADCTTTNACLVYGWCGASEGKCARVRSEADCSQSERCKEQGRCTYLDGACVR